MAPKPITITCTEKVVIPGDQIEAVGAAIVAAGGDPTVVLGDLITGALPRAQAGIEQPLTALGIDLKSFPGAGVEVDMVATGGGSIDAP